MNKVLFSLALTGIGLGLAINASATSMAHQYTQYENKKPSKAFMANAKTQYIRYCAACHAKDGTGRDGPALKGSLIVTGPMGGNIHMVITGGPHTRMPMWGLTELSDEALAEILTYVRNDWGNADKKIHGKHAGGVITPELVKKYRDALPTKNGNKTVRT